MSRLAAREKGEYYPTPISVVNRIARHLALPKKVPARRVVRLMDTSAGKGEALARLAKTLRREDIPLETWGVEINPKRAAKASGVLDSVLNAPFQVASWKSAKTPPASLLFQNPPYDVGSTGGRLETDFMRWGTRWLVPGGVLVWIIPYKTLTSSAAFDLLRSYENIRVYRFPDDEFDAFGQIVVLATKREQEVWPSWDEVSQETWYYEEERSWDRRTKPRPEELPVIGNSPDFLYVLSTASARKTLRRGGYTLEEVGEAAKEVTGAMYEDIRERLLPDHGDMAQPLMPPRTGHIAQMLAAGLMGVIEDSGRVIRGRVVKSVEVFTDSDGNEIHRDKYTTHIVYLDRNGLHHLSAPGVVTEFLKGHAAAFEKYVSRNYPPYGDSTEPQEDKILDTLSLDKRLPGTDRAGLRPAQRKAAVALTRSVKRYSAGHLVAEMGYGKTRTALASVELMNSYPALVICPPHLVDKWVREAQSVPGAKAIVVESITQFEEIRKTYRKGDKLVLVMSRSKIKLGSGWEPSYPVRHTLPQKGKGDALRAEFKEKVQKYRENPSPETRRAALNTAVPYPVCPRCGAPVMPQKKMPVEMYLSRYPAHCDRKVPKWNAEEEKNVAVTCHEPLFQYAGFRRWPLADYIRKKAKGFFKTLIADEVHQYKAKGSDQGWAFQVLAQHVPRVITLTGTFFGGPSTSVFYLLYRTQKNVRDEFGYGEETRWARQFGVIEEKWKETGGEDDFGDYTAKRKRRVSTKEKPGISPEIMRFILPTVYFGRIADLGIRMPPMSEEVVTIGRGDYGSADLWDRLEADWSTVYSETWDAMLDNWPHFTSSWLQWNLARPNSCFRDEVIEFPDDRPDLFAGAVVDENELLPKEQWLVETVKREVKEHRRVVVYVRQTGTRDIRHRVQQVLEQAGISGVVILNESVSPRKREKWLQGHHANVLITNPKLVETGLDLVQFSTVIFYEITYSLYTLWQAMRRVWRLGQTRPVRIFYAVYADTLEEKALALIGEKMGAAKLLYGEDVAGALVPEQEDSLVHELVKAIKEHRRLTSPERFFSAAGDEVAQEVVSPVGSPTLPSQSLSIEEWLAKRGLTMDEVLASRKQRKKKVKVAAGQLALF